MTNLRLEVGERIWKYTNSAKVLKQEIWENNVTRFMRDFEHRIISAMKVCDDFKTNLDIFLSNRILYRKMAGMVTSMTV